MNCPYCDESIHPQAKFCAKCGLPLKEDTTVHGVSTTDDNGPSKYVIGSLLAGIVVIGLMIAVLGGQHPSNETARQPEPPRAFQTPGMGTGVAGTRPAAPAFSAMQASRPSFTAPRADANTSSTTHYVSPPPAALPVAPSVTVPSVVAPPVPLLAMTTGDAPKAPRVSVVRSNAPRVPSLPDSVASAAIPAMPEAAEPAAEPGERVNPNPDLYVWDPVQERWARRPDSEIRRRRAARTRRSNTAPAATRPRVLSPENETRFPPPQPSTE